MLALLAGCCPAILPTGALETRYQAPGPWSVTYAPALICCDSKNNAFDVFYPATIRQNGAKLPLLLWGNGSFAQPVQYRYFLEHLASWGFVVVATRDSMTGAGTTLLDALAKMQAQSADSGSLFYQKLDLGRVGSVGHSQGAGGALNALINAPSATPIQTAVAIELPAHAWCLANQATCADASRIARGSVFFIDGSADTLISPPLQDPAVPGQESIAGYYAAVPAAADKLKATLLRAQHNDIQGQPRCSGALIGCCAGADGYLGYITAWLMDRLQGDTTARGAFVQNSGEIFAQATNWEYVDSNIH